MTHKALVMTAPRIPSLKVVAGALSMLKWRKVEKNHGVSPTTLGTAPHGCAKEQEPSRPHQPTSHDVMVARSLLRG